MKICGTNLIPILITIVSCGVIFMYFNMRLAEVKSAVDKQNRVLTSFITNVQNDIKNGGTIMGMNILDSFAAGAGANTYSVNNSANEKDSPLTGYNATVGVNHLASEEAIRSIKLNEKIVVFDDSDSESDSDSDNESNTSSDSEDEVNIEDVTSEDIKVINLQDCVSLELITDNLPLDFEQVPTSVQVPTIVDDSSTWQVSELLDESANVLKTVDLNAPIDLTKTDVNYEQMKVDDLRKIVLDFNLASKDEVKKLKKPELLILLKNKTA